MQTEPSTLPAVTIAIRYHEIAIKKGNRTWFEERLATNAVKLVQRALEATHTRASEPVTFQRAHGRLFLIAPWTEAVKQALSCTFGISNFSIVKTVPTNLQAITELSIKEFFRVTASWPRPPRSFRVQTRRSEKALPQTSAEIDRIVGSQIAGHEIAHRWRTEDPPCMVVDLDHPELTLSIEIRRDVSHLWSSKELGPGGLPVGSNGHVLALLSGGIDSPVAALQMLKRGLSTSLVHFYGTPFVGADALRKVQTLAAKVNAYQPDPKHLYIVPFGLLQEKVAQKINPKVRTILYRRIMLQIANRIAKRIHARAIVTGEALGQVASQTLINLSAIDQASERVVLRPLIGFDKDEIIQLAQKYGTYETSILPAIDCCTLFADRNPVIAIEPAVLESEEAKIKDELPDWINEAIQNTEKVKLT